MRTSSWGVCRGLGELPSPSHLDIRSGRNWCRLPGPSPATFYESASAEPRLLGTLTFAKPGWAGLATLLRIKGLSLVPYYFLCAAFGGVVGHNMAAALASRAVRAGSGKVNVDVRCQLGHRRGRQLEWSRKRRGRDRGPGIRHQKAEAGAQAECRSVRKGLRIRPVLDPGVLS